MRKTLVWIGLAMMIGQGQMAAANDSVAGFGVGGLELRQTDAVRMVSEDLHITPYEIRVRYVFRNETDDPVTGIVAFPLPPVGGEDWIQGYALPHAGHMDYVGFSTLVDGVPVVMTPEHRITLDGQDRTADFLAIGVHAVAVHGWEILEIAERDWTDAQKAALRAQGFVTADGRPRWVLQSTYWREQTFAPHSDVVVEHTYRPVAAGSVDSRFPGATPDSYPESADPARAESRARYFEQLDAERARYCVTPEIEERMRTQFADRPEMAHRWIFMSDQVDYILTTGNNWRGPIGRFSLTVESPGAWDFVFLCLPGAHWTSQSRVEFTAEDFVPTDDLSIYFSRAVGPAIDALSD